MNTTTRRAGWTLALILAAVPGLIAGAQSEPATPAAVTTANPELSLAELDLMLLPLTKAELEVEAAAWMDLLQAKVQALSTAELAVTHKNAEIAAAKAAADAANTQATGDDAAPATPAPDAAPNPAAAEKAEAEAAAKQQLLDSIVSMRTERAALIERTNTVLDALEKKGGDIKEQQLYVAAVSGIRIDVTDASALWTTISGWVTSPEGGIKWGTNIAKFLAVFFAFWVLAVILGKATDRALTYNKRLSQLVRAFLSKSVRRLILAIGIVVAVAALGINTAPLLAAIGAAGLVIGLALQGTLSNFASGILILIYRPFDVGDAVEVGGVTGKVESLSLVSTTVKTFDNKVLILPNNKVWGDTITNVTGSTKRRVDMVFGVGYDADLSDSQAILERLVKEHPLTLDDPEPTIKVSELADSSVNFVCRPWCKTDDYWTVFFDLTRSVKEAFDKAGISIPFPQRDVHVYHETKPPAEAPTVEVPKRSGEHAVS